MDIPGASTPLPGAGTVPASSPAGSGTDSGDASDGDQGNAGSGEPGFEPAGEAGLPSMQDVPDFDDQYADEGSGGTGPGETPGEGSENGKGSESGDAAQAGATGDSGAPRGTATSGGPLTAAEKVSVLDAALEKGTGEFDSMILEEQQRQRQVARDSATHQAQTAAKEKEATENGSYADVVASRSAENGRSNGAGPGAGSSPTPAAKYPPPKDIPSGDDDDVVARQLREAAMREPDPAVRKKLWDEYRKYKGIEK